MEIKDEDIRPESVPSDNKEQEIDLIEIGVKLWNARWKLMIWVVFGAIIGLIIALSLPKVYTASVKLVPETGEAKSGSNLGALAAFAGINLGSSGSSDAVDPSLYPDIVNSKPFSVELLTVELPTDINNGSTLSLEQILRDHTDSPWWSSITSIPGKIIGSFSSGETSEAAPDNVIDPFRLTKNQSALVAAVNGSIKADVDSKTDVVNITVELQDPLAAASLADTVAERLQEYIVAYRTGKARNDLAYAKKINKEAKESYYEWQRKYANFVDRNKGLVSKTAQLEQDRLQNEMQLAYTLYNSTAQQVQLAEAKVQSNTPVFAVVEPASVPNIPSKPRKMIILAAMIFLAFVAGSAYVLFVPSLKTSVRRKKMEIKNRNYKTFEE